MTAQDPLRIAIRSGIGARALELGFKRKSERLYVREDDAYREWVYFSKHKRFEWGFTD